MEDYYCIYDQDKKPIAIFPDIYNSIKFKCCPDYLETQMQRINILPNLKNWFETEQPKGKLIGYFLNRKDASEFFLGEFTSKKLERHGQSQQII